MSVAQDDRFDEAEADVDRGTPWKFREPDAPNPLTILATGWSTGHTDIGDAEFLAGTDRNGKKWSVLVGNVVLTKRLIEGLVEEWDDDKGAKFLYPDFDVVRKPPIAPSDEKAGGGPDGDIPFAPTSIDGTL